MAVAVHWEAIQNRHNDLIAQLSDPFLDREKRHLLQKEANHLKHILEIHQKVVTLHDEIATARELAQTEKDAEMADLYAQEIASLQEKHTLAEKELDEVIVPTDEHDDRSVFLEIRAGTGGQEAALFAGDLLRMYTNYALNKGWKATIESESGTDLGGYREVILHIQGKNVYGFLKHESGVHRVQRVPATETQGRVHTSTATVAVLPEAKEVDIQINPSDLRVDVFRASGAGGQHVNTTDSAVRITHIPSGVVVSCQDERSQHKNKAKAMKVLQSRLLAHQMEKQAEEMSKERKSQVGGGKRSEKARTYNYPQNRITDHQIGLTLKKLDIVMTGDLDEIIEGLRAHDHQERTQEFMMQFK